MSAVLFTISSKLNHRIMFAILCELDNWATILMGDIYDPYISENNKNWEHFHYWILNNSNRFVDADDSIQKDLKNVYDNFLRGSYLLANRKTSSGGSFWGTVDQVGQMAAIMQMNKMRKVAIKLLDIEKDYIRKKMINKGVKNAMEYLQKDFRGCTNQELANSFHMIQKRYSDLEVMQMRGVVSHENYLLEQNRIHESLLRLINR